MRGHTCDAALNPQCALLINVYYRYVERQTRNGHGRRSLTFSLNAGTVYAPASILTRLLIEQQRDIAASPFRLIAGQGDTP